MCTDIQNRKKEKGRERERDSEASERASKSQARSLPLRSGPTHPNPPTNTSTHTSTHASTHPHPRTPTHRFRRLATGHRTLSTRAPAHPTSGAALGISAAGFLRHARRARLRPARAVLVVVVAVGGGETDALPALFRLVWLPDLDIYSSLCVYMYVYVYVYTYV